MDNRERFFAGETFEIAKAFGDYKVYIENPGDDYAIMEKTQEGRWEYYANITAISIGKCTAFSLFFNKLIEKDLVFNELIFKAQEGGEDVEL